jgi:hypothetical protein
MIAKDGARFLLAKLILLQQRLEGIMDKRAEEGTITPLRKSSFKGEKDGERQTTQAVTETTGADDSHLGADDPAPVEPVSKG